MIRPDNYNYLLKYHKVFTYRFSILRESEFNLVIDQSEL